MPDDINKVINFDSHKNKTAFQDEQKIKILEDGIYYVRIDKDDNGHKFNVDHILNKADNCHYLVRILVEKNESAPAIYAYKVPGNKLTYFLKKHINGEIKGHIIEIEKFKQDDLA